MAAATLGGAFGTPFVVAQTVWLNSPATGDWNTAANWSPADVPNTAGETAVFGNSSITAITLSAETDVGGIVFTAGASQYTISQGANILRISSGGVVNNSGLLQTISINAGTAFADAHAGGSDVAYNISSSGYIQLQGTSSAGAATFTLSSNGYLQFLDSSTGENARLVGLTGATFASQTSTETLRIGSLEGEGRFQIINQTGATPEKTLSVGWLNTSTTYGGIVYDADFGVGPVVGTLEKVGTGTLTLTGANTYAGGTIITGGTLQLGNGGTTGSVVGDITNNSALIFNRSNAVSFDGVISGTGSMTKLGAGQLTLTGTNTYTGGTTITGGTLQVGDGGTTGSITGNVTNNAALIFNRSNNASFAGVISGTGTLTKSGAGGLTLTGANTYSGGSTLNGGTLLIGHNNALGTGGLTIGNGTTLSTNGSARTITNNITASGNFSINPDGTIVGVSAFALNGSLNLGNATRTITNPSLFTDFDFGVVSFGGVISNGGLTLNALPDAGVVFFRMNGAGSNTYTGLTTLNTAVSLELAKTGGATAIAGNLVIQDDAVAVIGLNEQIANTASVTINGVGRLQVGNPTDVTETIGSLAGDGEVELNDATTGSTIRVGSGTFSGEITGGVANGTSLEKYSTGLLTLGGVNTFLGDTLIGGGELRVNGSLAGGDVTVQSGTTLSGSGQIGGAVDLLDGATLAPGTSPGTLQLGALTLQQGSTTVFELGDPAGTPGVDSDLVRVTGALTLNGGSVNVVDLGDFGSGTYTLFEYGSLTGTDLRIGSAVGGYNYEFDLDANGGTAIQLIAAFDNLQFWDGASTSPGNPGGAGGTGTWNATTTNWTNANGTANTAWADTIAVFGGTAGTVTLADNLTIDGLQFLTDGYVIQSATNETLTANGVIDVSVDEDVTAEVATRLVGTGGINKTDDGTLVLTNANTYTGGTTITGGTLQIGDGSTTGSVAGNIQNNADLAFNRSDNVTFSGVISGTGDLTKNEAGSLTLTAVNTYSGTTFLDEGTLRIGHNSALGTSNLIIADGTTLSTNGSARTITNNITAAGDFSINPDGTMIGVSAFALNGNLDLGDATRTITNPSLFTDFDFGVVSFGGVISNGGLTLNALPDAGVVFFEMAGSGSNTYTGLTTLNTAVSLQLAKTGGATAIAGDIVIEDDAVAVIALGEQIANTASVTINGIGRLQVGNPTDVTETIGSLSGDGEVTLNDNSTGSTIRVGSGTFSGEITGGVAGGTSLEKYSAGLLTLEGTNTYLGDTLISGGELRVNGSLADGDVTVQSGATLSGSGQIGGAVDLLDGAFLRPGTSPGTIQLGALTLQEGSTTVFELGDPTGTPGVDSDLVRVTGALTLNGGSVNLVDLADFAEGTYTLFEYGSLTGTDLRIGSAVGGYNYEFDFDANGGTAIQLIANFDNLQFWDGANTTSPTTAGGVGGTATWDASTTNWTNQNGTANTAWADTIAVFGGTAGTVTLADNVTIDGLQFVTDGYVIQSDTNETLTADGVIDVILNEDVTAEIASVFTGTGGINKAGDGTLVLTAANNYTGGTTVSSGTLQIGNGGTAGSVSGNILNNASLVFDRSDDVTFAGIVSGSGTLTKAGDAALTLDAENTYSGGTALNEGTLRIGHNSALGTGSLIIAADATLSTDGSARTITNNITAAGDFSINPDGTVVGTNAFALNGNLDLGDETRTITNPSIYADGDEGLVSFGGVISNGALTLNALPGAGAAFFQMDGAASNTYTGLTTLNTAVSLQLAKTGGATAIAGDLVIQDDAVAVIVLDEQIADDASVTINGIGRLQIGIDTNVTETIGNLSGDGQVTLNDDVTGSRVRIASGDFDGEIDGGLAGGTSLEKYSTGLLTLDGTNTFLGNTLISAGELRVNGSLADGDVTVQSGATLSGSGQIGGAVDLLDGATLAPGTSPGAIQLGALTLQEGSATIFELGSPAGTPGVDSDLVRVTGALTLNGGRVDLVDLADFASGTYTLFEYGSLTGTDLRIGSAIGGYNYEFDLDANGGTAIQLVADFNNLQFWDGANTSAPSTAGGVGGSGTWDASTTNWTNQNGNANTAWADTIAVFGGTAGTVTLADDLTIDGLQFVTDGYVIQSDTNETLTPDGVIDVILNEDVTAEVASALTGNGGINKAGDGTLVLTGANDYTGGTSISSGTLRLGDGGDLTGNIANSGAFEVDRTTAWTYDGVISGAGNLRKSGTGDLTLRGVNTYTGGTTIDGGALVLADNGTLTGDIANSGTFVNRRTSNWTFADTMTGTGVFVHDNANTTTLAGNLNNTGGLRINEGRVRFTSGNIEGPIVNNGAFVVTRSGDYTFDQVISGTGRVVLDGNSNITFLAANTYTGPTFVRSGALTLSGSVGGNVTISSGASLRGNGSIGGDFTNHGLLSPGNSPGILLVAGDVVFGSGGTFFVEIAGADPSQYDQVHAEGSATLGGRLQIEFLDGFVAKSGQRFNILTAEDGITGEFDEVDLDFETGSALSLRVVANPDEPGIDVLVVSLPYADFVLTPNQRSIARALDAERLRNPGSAFDPYFAVWDLASTDLLPVILESLIPSQINAAIPTTLGLSQANSVRFANRMQTLRLTGVRPAPVAADAPATADPFDTNVPAYGFWVEAGGTFADISNTPGSREYAVESGLAHAGIDYRVGPNAVAGFAARYQRTDADIDANGGTIDIEGGGGSFYGLYQFADTGFYLQGQTGAAANHYVFNREFALPGFGMASTRGDTDGWELNADTAVGWSGAFSGFHFTAEAGVRYSRVEIDGFSESGATPFNVAYDEQSGESLQTVLTTRLRRPMPVRGFTLVPEIRASWRHEHMNQDLRTTARFTTGLGTPFRVRSEGTGRDIADLGIGATLLISEALSVYANYDAQLANDYTAHNVTTGVRWAW